MNRQGILKQMPVQCRLDFDILMGDHFQSGFVKSMTYYPKHLLTILTLGRPVILTITGQL